MIISTASPTNNKHIYWLIEPLIWYRSFLFKLHSERYIHLTCNRPILGTYVTVKKFGGYRPRWFIICEVEVFSIGAPRGILKIIAHRAMLLSNLQILFFILKFNFDFLKIMHLKWCYRNEHVSGFERMSWLWIQVSGRTLYT